MNIRDEARAVAEELESFTVGLNDEVQEAMDHLIALTRYDYCLTPAMNKRILTEMKVNLKIFRHDYEWVEKEVTSTHTARSLEFKK